MLRKFLIIVLLISACAGISFAQDSVTVYSLDRALLTAKQNNSELVNAKLDKMKAERKVSEVYSENLVPTMTLNSQYIRAFKKQVFDIFGQRYEIGTDNQIINSLQVTEPIPVLGTPVFQGINIAEEYTNLQSENVSYAEAKISAEVKKSYYNVLFLKELVNVRKLNLQNALDNYDVVEKRYRNGTTTEFEYLRAKVLVENIKPNVLEAENNLEISKLVLKNSMGLKDNKPIDVSGTLSYDSLEVFGSTDELINHISENNVSVRQLRINQNINRELLAIDNANFLPKLYLFGSFNLQSAEDDGRTFGGYRYFNVINAGIGLTWDLNIFRNTYKKQQTQIEIKKTDETLADVKQKLRLKSTGVLLKIEEAKKKVISNTETVRLAERSYELASASFRNGVINQIDVTDAGVQLSNSRLGYYSAVLEYLLARTELEELLEKK
ncbi:MAG: TolC family protein [Ignavibacteria bacterium]|jgi:outer membrane protein TolC|nr:TolC family protein [Ignavibacteria bacterium]